jgi:hypothetical protein
MAHKGITITDTEEIQGEIRTNEHHHGATKKLEMNTTFFTRVPVDIKHERNDCGRDLFSTNKETTKSKWG